MSDQPAILGGNPVRPPGGATWPLADPETAAVFAQLAATGDWGRYHGPHCTNLEALIKEYFSTEYVHLCSSGTAAVELALRAAGVKSGDEVILSAYDFKGNFANVVLLGAVPLFVDVEPHRWLIDLEQFKQAVSPKTKAVIFSHLHGELVNIPLVQKFCQERGIIMIEDVCQVPGAKLDGKRCAQFGDLATLSFGGSKLLTAGRGGAVLTNNSQFSQRITLYEQRGNLAYPLSEMQAAVLVPQFHQLDLLNEQRCAYLKDLTGLLSHYPGLKVSPINENSAYYKLGMLYNDPAAWAGMSRELWIKSMQAEGISVDFPFRSLHLIHSRKRFISYGELQHATKIDQQLVVWHHPSFLEGTSSIEETITALNKIKDFAHDIVISQ